MMIFDKLKELIVKLPPETDSEPAEGKERIKLNLARACRLSLITLCAMLAFWEIIIRPVISIIFPDADLPPSVLSDVVKMIFTLAVGL